MATTANYGWTTPDDTDLVKDGASAIRTLGSAIDTTVKANADATGLVHINTTSFSAVASQSISNFVTSDYEHYKIYMRITGSTNLVTGFKFRENLTDKSTNYYGAGWYYRLNNTSGISGARNNGTDAPIGATTSSGYMVAEMLYSIQGSGLDGHIIGQSWDDNSGGGLSFTYKCDATAITGLSIIASTGTITGEISIFGVKK